jgi:hypothetical protein
MGVRPKAPEPMLTKKEAAKVKKKQKGIDTALATSTTDGKRRPIDSLNPSGAVKGRGPSPNRRRPIVTSMTLREKAKKAARLRVKKANEKAKKGKK